MLGHAITAVADIVRAVIAGSPILARRLYAPTAKRRAEATALRAKTDEVRAAARTEQLAKLTGAALLAAQKAHAAEDEAERAEGRSRAADIAGGAVLAALVGGPVAWSVLGPWVPATFSSAAGLWCVAAIMHAPARAEAQHDDGRSKGDNVSLAQPGEPTPEELRQAVLDRLLDWVGDRRGIHLAEVYERYRELPGHGHLTDTQIRASLVDHYAVPVRPAVRTPDGVRAGIHRDDLQPLPSPAVADTVAEERNSTVTSTVAA